MEFNKGCIECGAEAGESDYCNSCFYGFEATQSDDSFIDEDYYPRENSRSLSRHERLQMAADYGYDTWENYRGER